jgi:hypothetical protein
MRRSLGLLVLGGLLAGACSVVNSPEEPIGSNAGGGAFTASATSGASTSASGAGGGVAPKCGDGKLNGSEQCDDGKESAACNVDCSKAACGDGKINAAAGEDCDESGMQSATCEASCKKPACGDGTVNLSAMEECEPGAADVCCASGCKAMATCMAPQAIALGQMGTSMTGKVACAATALKQVPAATCGAGMSGAGSDRVFAFKVTQSSAATIRLDGNFDGLIRLLSKPCDLASEVPGGAADGTGCINAVSGKGMETLSYQVLCPGDYVIVVDGVGEMDAGTFTLEVELKPITNPIVNGGFEQNYQGWTIQQIQSPQAIVAGIAKSGQVIQKMQPVLDFAKNVSIPVQSPAFPQAYTATEGTQVAIYAENGPGNQRVYQDVIVAGCTLKWDLMYKSQTGFTGGQLVSVNLRDPATNMILEQPFVTKPGDPLQQPNMKAYQLDVKKYANKKIRIEVEVFGTLNYMDAAYDNFRIE